MIDKIPFSLFGLDLLEPMAFVTNGLVTLVCLFGFIRAQKNQLNYWKYFFISFAVASFSGALSHLFWNYWGFYGKIAPWFFGVMSSGFLMAAMIELFSYNKSTRLILFGSIVVKGILVLFFAYSYWNFLFVAIDTILSLFVACGLGAFILYFHYSRKEIKNILIGFLVMFPSAAIFLFKFDLNRWMNREDISHILIAIGLIFFVKNLIFLTNDNEELVVDVL